MKYSPRCRLLPTDEQDESLDWTRNTVRQVYNHGLYRLDQIPDDTGMVAQRVTRIRDELPSLKDWWTDLNNVYSKVLQTAIERIKTNIDNLGKLKKKGYKVGSLNWKRPRDFRSFTYNQRGFKLDTKSGPDGKGLLYLSKIGWIPIRLHRDLPEHDRITEVTVKKDAAGDWHASFTIETVAAEKPPVDEIDPNDCVGIDLGVQNHIHDSNGVSVDRLDLREERERLEREQRALSRKEYDSRNWNQQRREVAKVHRRMTRRKQDFKHKLAHHYTTEYDAVFLEDLNVKGMLEQDGNARNKHEAGWRDLITIFKHHGRKNGCHVETVRPEYTTIDCASCPTCGFTLDRDWNAALNVLSGGKRKLGVVHSEETPVETVLPGSTPVDPKHVVEAGSPALKEPATAGE